MHKIRLYRKCASVARDRVVRSVRTPLQCAQRVVDIGEEGSVIRVAEGLFDYLRRYFNGFSQILFSLLYVVVVRALIENVPWTIRRPSGIPARMSPRRSGIAGRSHWT